VEAASIRVAYGRRRNNHDEPAFDQMDFDVREVRL
jgi:hypothetical protein